jgi:hypothetical protein
MKYFFTHSLTAYSPKNQKQSELIAVVKGYNNLLIEKETGLDAFSTPGSPL